MPALLPLCYFYKMDLTDNKAFRFKQFSVVQTKCAMKVNTDGVLLGAWADVSSAKSILDMGTGTGVIALMTAQKNAVADIHAIDIDQDAYLQSKENFEQSNWSRRLTSFHIALQSFEPGVKYDVIISNPPYFIDDHKTASHQKNVAKHSVALSYEELLKGIARLLSRDGKAFLVLPVFNLPVLETIAEGYNLFVVQCTEVTAVAGKPPYLFLLQIERDKKNFGKSRITIQDTLGDFTGEYKMLTRDFYLKF